MGESSSVKYPSKFIPSPLKGPSPDENKNKVSMKFASYREAPYLTPRTRMLCEIVSETPPSDVETALNNTGITPIPELVEDVLKLSYGRAVSAVSFFRWAGFFHKPSVGAWYLMVDLLGKNEMFDQMWDAVRSMKNDGLVSLPTFVHIFGIYCVMGRFDDAIMTFEVMEKYGVEPDVVAVNSLCKLICQEKDQTQRACNFLDKVMTKIPPNGDTYAILLEGWEKEGNVSKAKTTFGEMVVHVGWEAKNTAAYNAFLMTLVRGSQVEEALKFMKFMKGKGCLPSLKFFTNTLDILVKKNDPFHAIPLWDTMVGSGIMPNLITFNAMIGMHCNNKDLYNAFRFLDEMPVYGVFPDSLTYNVIFLCLVNMKKVREVNSFFKEMIKNEFLPSPDNCASAIEMLFDSDDPEMAIEIWNYLLDNQVTPLDESANVLLIGLCQLSRFSELKRFAYDMLDWKIIIHETTMKKLQNSLYKEGRSVRETYDSLERRWKAAYTL